MLQRILRFDEAALLLVSRWHSRFLTWLMRTFTRLGDASSWSFVAVVLLALGGQSAEHGLRLGAAALLATALSQAVKRLSRRRRPSAGISGFTALVDNPDAFSFPSGHTAAAFSVALAFADHPWAGPLFAGVAAAIGVSRVYLGAHYPLDVGIGAALGLVAGALARGWLS